MENKYAFAEPWSEIKVITPEMAEDMLEHNVKNRTISRSVVDMYMRDLKNGFWKISNDAITFDTNGVLINGQHRLHAIVTANVSAKALMLYGIDNNCMLVMDKQKRRTYTGTRQIMAEMPKYQTTGRVVGAMKLLATKDVKSSNGLVSDAALDEWFYQYPSIANFVYRAMNKWKKLRNAGICVAIICAMANNVNGVGQFIEISNNNINEVDGNCRNIKAALDFWNKIRTTGGRTAQLRNIAETKEALYLFAENRIRRNKKELELYPTSEIMLAALESELRNGEIEWVNHFME